MFSQSIVTASNLAHGCQEVELSVQFSVLIGVNWHDRLDVENNQEQPEKNVDLCFGDTLQYLPELFRYHVSVTLPAAN